MIKDCTTKKGSPQGAQCSTVRGEAIAADRHNRGGRGEAQRQQKSRGDPVEEHVKQREIGEFHRYTHFQLNPGGAGYVLI